ncbi:MAG: methyltransferase domain-containing protein [Rhodocyclaceae bacterium]|nr:methyltransferase domain-containing protein [Rhodocyclaceae bacterium]
MSENQSAEPKSLERIDPQAGAADDKVFAQTLAQHVERYEFAMRHVRDKLVLDVACGTGYGSQMLKRDGGARRVIGVDLSSEAIREARDTYAEDGVTFVQANLETDPLPESPVDCVVSFETIEHLEDPRRFLQTLHSVLRDDGVLIASVPTTQTSDFNRYHLHDFTPSQARDLIESCGFEVIETKIQPLFFTVFDLMRSSNAHQWESPMPENVWRLYMRSPAKLLYRAWMLCSRFGYDVSVGVFVARKKPVS